MITMKMNLRDWLANLLKFRGQVQVDLDKMEGALDVFTREDGTTEPRTRHQRKAFAVGLDATSAAVAAFGPVSASKYWLLRRALHSNANRNSRIVVSAALGVIASNGQSDAIPVGIVGQVDLLGLRADAGDIISVQDTEFVAADVVASYLVYEEYDL